MKRLALTAALTLTGCVTPRPHFAPAQAGATHPVRTAPAEIELFRSQAPTKKYNEIGALTVCCGSITESIEILKEGASQAGGDALMSLDVLADGSAAATVIRYQ